MVDTFWGVLPFTELSPDDEDATVTAQEPLRGVLARLWDKVVAPVLDRVGPTRRIWWVLTGLLAALPLHAAGHGGDLVLGRVISSYSPTIKVLRASRSRVSGQSDTASVVAVADAPGLPTLPRTRTEAFEVMRRFPAVTRLDGPTATPDAVLAAVADSGWLHLACHATSNVRDPANCRPMWSMK
ncbi:MAG TPA: CHAT domain-containing protein [Pseudonocardiaceae bacterium]|nr:CHAT domain-containing protein [Pseudonocardiaceae bacterium]